MVFVQLWLASDRGPPPGPGDPRSHENEPAGLLNSPILVIEDESMIAWMIEDVLAEAGFTSIVIVASGEQAKEQARRTPPRLIVSDVNLGPGEDGVDSVRSIRAWCNASAVFVTGYADATIRERIARDVGSAQLLRKPVEGNALLAAAMRALGN